MFVGRDREREELDAAIALATSGVGGLYLVTGEPGIGKTRLASEAISAARTRGCRTAWGRCWEGGGAPAFWPWREALDGLGLRFPDAIGAGDPADARFALFREVAAVLARDAARGPIVIALEDLHAADLTSLLLVEMLAPQLRGMPIVVIGTYRDVEISQRIESADVLSRAGRAGVVMPLGRLREPDVALLVRDAIDGADDPLAHQIFTTTDGNPLFVAEIVRDIRARGATAGASIPLGVREIIRRRLALISDDARRALEAAAVLGVEFGAGEITRMVADAAAVLDDMARSGLVTATGKRFRFSHALYREALYHDLPRARRHDLHRDAARAVASTGAPLAEIAHHLLEAGAPEAIDHAIRAADQALAVFAYEEAIALLERARAMSPDGVERGRVLVAIGEARIRSGDATGRTQCIEAAQLARELGDATLLAVAGLGYGSVFTMGSVDPVLVGMLEDALARLPDEDSALRARVMARLAAARQPSKADMRARDIELALAAIAMARRVAGPRELIGVLHSASGALYGHADPHVRLPGSRDQERLAEEQGDLVRLLAARARIAMDLSEMADFTSYAATADAFEEVASRIGRAAAPWRAPLMRSLHALATDRYAESERWQAEAKRIESDHPRARMAQAFHRIGFLRAAERHAELRASLSELRGLWLQMPFGVNLAEPRVASSLARIGADDEVRDILAKLPGDAFDEMINCAALSEAVWLAGTAEQANRLRPIFEPEPSRWTIYWLDCEIVECPNSRLLAYLAGVAGDWAACDRMFAHAMKLVDGVGRRSMAARMRFELADLFVRNHREHERAHTLLAEARELATSVGLPELVALIDRRHPAQRASMPFALVLEGEYYTVPTATGPLRFKRTRGMDYLAHLVERPGVDVHVLELAGSGGPVDRGDAGELLDAPAFRAYRERLHELSDQVDDAEAIGAVDRADRARAEMEAIAVELARGTGKGGQARRGESAVDRARSAVQRRIKDALDRIAEADSELGARLRSVVHTGNNCSYRP